MFSLSHLIGAAIAVGGAVLLMGTRNKGTALTHLKGYKEHISISKAARIPLQIIAAAPQSVRMWLLARLQAPRTVHIDARDLGKPDAQVYEYEVIVPGKVWRIGYTFQVDAGYLKKIGVSVEGQGREELLSTVPDDMRKVVEHDCHRYSRLAKQFSQKEGRAGGWQKAGLQSTHSSMVVKLPSGGLLLYAPPRIHKDLAAWLSEQGEVEYIVLGSGSHTLNIPAVATQYPNAKLVGPERAEHKLKVVKVRPFDFRTTDPKDLASLNQALGTQDVSVCSLDGSPGGEVIVIAHRQLFECDLLYASGDGKRMWSTPEQFESEDSLWLIRLFHFGITRKSYNQRVPGYRFALMDTSSLLARVSGNGDAHDGCDRMAASLRALMARPDWDQAVGVHHRLTLAREEFRYDVDQGWRWLDRNGRSLLE